MLPRVGTLPTWNAVPPNRAQLRQHVRAAQRSKKKTQSSKGMQLRGESLVPSSVRATTAAAQQLLTTKGGTRVDATQPRRACCGGTRVERDWVTWFFFGRPKMPPQGEDRAQGLGIHLNRKFTHVQSRSRQAVGRPADAHEKEGGLWSRAQLSDAPSGQGSRQIQKQQRRSSLTGPTSNPKLSDPQWPLCLGWDYLRSQRCST